MFGSENLHVELIIFANFLLYLSTLALHLTEVFICRAHSPFILEEKTTGNDQDSFMFDKLLMVLYLSILKPAD